MTIRKNNSLNLLFLNFILVFAMYLSITIIIQNNKMESSYLFIGVIFLLIVKTLSNRINSNYLLIITLTIFTGFLIYGNYNFNSTDIQIFSSMLVILHLVLDYIFLAKHKIVIALILIKSLSTILVISVFYFVLSDVSSAPNVSDEIASPNNFNRIYSEELNSVIHWMLLYIYVLWGFIGGTLVDFHSDRKRFITLSKIDFNNE